jgi:hypothetical protein
MYYEGKQVWRVRTENVDYDIEEDMNRWVYDGTEDGITTTVMKNIYEENRLHIPSSIFETIMEGVIIDGDEEDIL